MKKYDNYASALNALSKASSQDLSNDFIVSGIINKFALQFELGWKLFKALLAYEGDPVSASGSPRDILKSAYRYFDFMDEERWLCMLRDRNDTTHIYDEHRAHELVEKIISDYIPEFRRIQDGIIERYGDMLK